jgi:hypothetical protein
MKDAELLTHVEAEFKRGGIHERHLVAEGWHLDGLQEGPNVYVDPAPNVIDTLFHELIHRRYPHWSEAHVSRTASRLVGKMSHAEVRRWYRRYTRARRVVRQPKQAD